MAFFIYAIYMNKRFLETIFICSLLLEQLNAIMQCAPMQVGLAFIPRF